MPGVQPPRPRGGAALDSLLQKTEAPFALAPAPTQANHRCSTPPKESWCVSRRSLRDGLVCVVSCFESREALLWWIANSGGQYKHFHVGIAPPAYQMGAAPVPGAGTLRINHPPCGSFTFVLFIYSSCRFGTSPPVSG